MPNPVTTAAPPASTLRYGERVRIVRLPAAYDAVNPGRPLAGIVVQLVAGTSVCVRLDPVRSGRVREKGLRGTSEHVWCAPSDVEPESGSEASS